MTNKTDNKKSILDNILIRTNKIFEYENAPQNLRLDKLEYYLQTIGHCICTQYNNELVFLNGSFIGEFDIYNEQNQYQVSNNKISKQFDLQSDDVILFKNNFLHLPLINILTKYIDLISETEITLTSELINSRAMFSIIASDNISRNSAEQFIKKLQDGDLSVISQNAFLESIKFLPINTQTHLIDLITTLQYLKGSLLNEIGINANFNMKKEQIVSGEYELNTDYLTTLISAMYDQRLKDIEQLNEKFDLNVKVKISGIWLKNFAENEYLIHSNLSAIESISDENTLLEHIKNTDIQDTINNEQLQV